MRIAYSALMSVLLASAVPSVCFAQVSVPCHSRDQTSKEVVPVATMTRLGDAIALADAQPEDVFVLGSAKLDMKDPACTKIVFTMTNATGSPISLTNVSLHGVRMTLSDSPVNGLPLKSACSIGIGSIDHRFVTNTTLAPGATVTVDMPVARGCPNLGRTVGFLVSIRSDGTDWWAGDTPHYEQTREAALLRRAFETLTATKQ
jgi:hypothetical protein